MSILKGKHIILGITGGIAAYKSATLLRLFVKAGAEVQVVITPNGREFITPVTLSALSGKPVISEFFTANTGSWNSHVDLGLWADAMVIAPATAASIAKMANGVADNMLITTYLSAKKQVFVAPAMDLDMMAHPSTQRNIDMLKDYGDIIIDSESGELASHLVGKGRMAEPEHIFSVIENYFAIRQDASLSGKKILITAGPTYERIDPVRFIGNYSSGKMGYAIADEAARRGANVILVSGPVSIQPKEASVKVIKIESAREMLDACGSNFQTCDIAIMAAAVADYAPKVCAKHKIKREEENIEFVELVKNPDIASTLAHKKRSEQLVIGFALETDNEENNAISKIKRKGLDAIVLNSLRDPGAGFGVETNKIKILRRDGSIILTSETKAKTEIAKDILDNLDAIKSLAKE